MPRQKLPAKELEEKCVEVLSKCLGLKHITYARVRPYEGQKSWTWEMWNAGPDAHKQALDDAMPGINKLQQKYDLA